MTRVLVAMLLVLVLAGCDSLMESLIPGGPDDPAGEDDGTPVVELLPDLYLPWGSAVVLESTGQENFVAFTFILANRGDADAPEASVDVSAEFHPYDPRDESWQHDYGAFRTFALAPGGTSSYSIEMWSPGTPGDVVLNVTIDPEGLILQSDRSNDSGTWVHTVPHPCIEPQAEVEFHDAALRLAIMDQFHEPTTAITCHELSRLTNLFAYDRGITSLEGLQDAASLRQLHVANNLISDLAPLVANESLMEGSTVDVQTNCLDLTPNSVAMQQISDLQDRGVVVYHEGQRACGAGR